MLRPPPIIKKHPDERGLLSGCGVSPRFANAGERPQPSRDLRFGARVKVLVFNSMQILSTKLIVEIPLISFPKAI